MLNTTFWITTLIFLFAIFELLRRKTLKEKYAVVWLLLGLLILFGSLFPNLINKISGFLGFQFLSNFVLFIFGILNFFISMQLSLSIGKTENQIQTLAEDLAILKSKDKQIF